MTPATGVKRDFLGSQGLPTLGAALASDTKLPAKPPRNVFARQGMALTTTMLTYRQCFQYQEKWTDPEKAYIKLKEYRGSLRWTA